MFEMSTLIYAIIGGFIGSMLVRVATDRLSYPYQWKCGVPGCNTRARSNIAELVERAKRIHYESQPTHEGAHQ